MASREFLDFLDKCPTPFHTTAVIRDRLISSGYVELDESKEWASIPPKGFVERDGHAILAFNQGGLDSSIIVSTHSDSPCLRLKPSWRPSEDKANVREIRVVPYGNIIFQSYFNRDFRVAGAVFLRDGNVITRRLFDSETPIAFLPGAPSTPVDKDTDYNLVFTLGGHRGFDEYVAAQLGVAVESIADWEFSFVDGQTAETTGINQEFVSARGLDGLGSTFSGLTAFLASTPSNTLNIFVSFDHEQVRCYSKHGGLSDFLPAFLRRVLPDPSQFSQFVSKSLIVSSGNVHGLHPNWPKKYDPANSPVLGGGVAVKELTPRENPTDITSIYPIRLAAKAVGVSLSVYARRNDITPEPTIGTGLATRTGIPTVELGAPQLAMHSAREVMAFKDLTDLTKLLGELYNRYPGYRLEIDE
jgi:aspartyl aminopeptidase